MFTPIGERVLVERQEEKKTTESGLFIPDEAQEKPQVGKVVSIGHKVGLLHSGDTVYFGKYAGTDITVDGKPFLIIHQDDLLGYEPSDKF